MKLDDLVDRLTRGIERLLAYAFIVAILINLASVVGRYGFGKSVLGADEVMIYIMVWMTFLGAVVVTWRRQHLAMDLLTSYLPQGAVRALRILEQAVLVVLAGLVAVQSAGYTRDMFNLGRASDGGQIPMWIPHSSVAVGFALIALIALLRLVRLASGAEQPVRAPAAGDDAVEGARP